MNTVVGIDLRTTGHTWLVERAAAWTRMAGGVVDLVFFHPDGGTSEQQDRLEALLAELPEAQRGTARVLAAAPAAGLVELTEDADLLVVGSREPAALERWLHGPMATRVLRHAHCPVLVPRRPEPPRDTPKLLVGVDVNNPPVDRAIVELASRWAVMVGGTLDALYAVNRALPPIANHAVRERAEKEWEARNDSERRRLQLLLDEVVPEGHRGQAQIGRGEAEDAIIHASSDADLVLVGNRDREGLAQLVLGTVAQRVVRQAHCDVLSLPTAGVDLP